MASAKCPTCGWPHPEKAPHIWLDAAKQGEAPAPPRRALVVDDASVATALVTAVAALRPVGALPAVPTPAEVTAILQEYATLKAQASARREKKAAAMRHYRKAAKKEPG